MTIETNKETLCINQIIGNKTETVIIEDDFVVPDIKPDILNCINTSGNICIYKKEMMDGKIRFDGCINTYIIYLAESEENSIRSFNANLEFSQIIDFDELKNGMMVDTNVSIKQIECRVLNGRKINVKAIIEIDIKAYSNENLDFINEINNISDTQLLRSGISINSLLGSGSTKVYAKDTIMIDGVDEIAEIMKVNVDIKNKETKTSYNKVLIKADGTIKIMYLTTDNRICTKTSSIPIMGFIDMQDVNEDCICDVNYEIKNIIVKPNNIEEHSVYAEIEVEVNCNCYQTRNLNIIEDLYSPSVNLVYKQNHINTMSQKGIIKDRCSIREKQFIEEVRNSQIYDVDVRILNLDKTILDGRIVFEGDIELNFLFGNSNNGIQVNSKIITIPFNYNMESPNVNKSNSIETSIEVLTQDFVVMPDESIDIKLDLEFVVSSYKNERINVIEQIDIEENRDQQRCSLIIYFVKPNDTLWLIAKKYKSTVEDIVLLNKIEDKNKIEVGEKLFIPMFHG